MQVRWYGTKENSEPEWGSGRFIAMTIEGPEGNAVYAAWNTAHEPVVATLPERHGLAWRVVADSSKPAPFDVVVEDERLSGASAAAAAAASAGWTAAGVFPMLPWSCVVMELVQEDEVADVGDPARWDELAAATRAAQAAAQAAAAAAAAKEAIAAGEEPPHASARVDTKAGLCQHRCVCRRRRRAMPCMPLLRYTFSLC